jgi:hypothetical protein
MALNIVVGKKDYTLQNKRFLIAEFAKGWIVKIMYLN